MIVKIVFHKNDMLFICVTVFTSKIHLIIKKTYLYIKKNNFQFVFKNTEFPKFRVLIIRNFDIRIIP